MLIKLTPGIHQREDRQPNSRKIVKVRLWSQLTWNKICSKLKLFQSSLFFLKRGGTFTQNQQNTFNFCTKSVAKSFGYFMRQNSFPQKNHLAFLNAKIFIKSLFRIHPESSMEAFWAPYKKHIPTISYLKALKGNINISKPIKTEIHFNRYCHSEMYLKTKRVVAIVRLTGSDCRVGKTKLVYTLWHNYATSQNNR